MVNEVLTKFGLYYIDYGQDYLQVGVLLRFTKKI